MEGPSTSLQLLTSGYSSTILGFSKTENGSLEPRILSQEEDISNNYSWIISNKNIPGIFYIAHELDNFDGQKTGAVSRWELRDGKSMTKFESISSGGPTTCHLSFDPIKNVLYVANYGEAQGGSFSAFKIDSKDGKIIERIFNEVFGKGSNVVPERQENSHPHAVNLYKNNIYVCDLGNDNIWHYQIEDNKNKINNIKKIGSIETPKGSGPRHMAIDEKSGMAYVLFELQCQIGIYEIDSESGNLKNKCFVSTITNRPANSDQYGAEIAIHPNMPYLYASNRGHGPLIVYEISQDGSLLQKQVLMAPNVWPRHFTISSDGKNIFLAEQLLNKLQVWDILDDGTVSMNVEIPSENSPAIVIEL